MSPQVCVRHKRYVMAEMKITKHTIVWHFLDDLDEDSSEATEAANLERGPGTLLGNFVRSVGNVLSSSQSSSLSAPRPAIYHRDSHPYSPQGSKLKKPFTHTCFLVITSIGLSLLRSELPPSHLEHDHSSAIHSEVYDSITIIYPESTPTPEKPSPPRPAYLPSRRFIASQPRYLTSHP
ncbi:hypothetical protein AZE42_07632 [Rhizopogon vesiculosus]|uniref:Uncharacterized protein n=1 Tax=Rhizopogon vesiculosus TaxID=180088 RepID=A0A1J8Q695_9AGAM|nr:hypothetical protein AZE42_07632 [Rhizopogon vesiculosus]